MNVTEKVQLRGLYPINEGTMDFEEWTKETRLFPDTLGLVG
jgi:hypothetical protein